MSHPRASWTALSLSLVRALRVEGPYVVHVLGPCVGTRMETFLAMRAGNVFFRPIYDPTELELTFDADCERGGRLRLLDALEDIDYRWSTLEVWPTACASSCMG
jgi:hypothetical protein